MDLNNLLFHHQVALIDGSGQGRGEARRWAGLCAAFYAGEIERVRRLASRPGALAGPRFGERMTAHG